MKRSIQAVVPGSTSNLGPGFDLFGLAVDLYLRVTVSIEGSFSMVGTADTEWLLDWQGEGSGPPAPVPLDESNLVVQGVKRAWESAGLTLDGRVEITGRSDIPVARGLGASGAAIVAGLLAGSHLCEAEIDEDVLINLATAEEGHPDNVAPSLRGGLIAAAVMDDGEVFLHRGRLYEDYLIGAVIPELALSTRHAREALPGQIPHIDAVRSQQRAFFLFHALEEGRTGRLNRLVHDTLHQQYRARLIPAFDDLFGIARRNGADAVWLSGSGPTIIVLCEGTIDMVEKACDPLVERWAAEEIVSRVVVVGPDDLGGAVIEE
ncbi:homoserine kinase [Gemmatimonadota bacterium]